MSTFSQLKAYIKADLYRHEGKTDTKTFYLSLFKHKGFLLTTSYRWGQYIVAKNVQPFVFLFQLYYKFLQIFLSAELPLKTKLGPGVYFVHLLGTVFHEKAVIGKNLHITHNVTIGATGKGYPVIGNNVVIMPGAKIFGKITVGDNAVIGANAVVSKDVPENAIMAGVPARVLAMTGSADYTFNLPHEH
jgi:serine O-acetyltransferase